MDGAVNKAGRHRMLGQRIVKCHLQIVEGVCAASALSELADSIQVFDRHLADLKQLAGDSALRDTIDGVEGQWLPFRRHAIAPSSRASAVKMLPAGERLLEAAERNTAAFERRAGTPAARLVNLSGRQRMLSQRVAKNHLLVTATPDSNLARAELASTWVEFVLALNELRASPYTNAEIKGRLLAVSARWNALLDLLTQDTDRERALAEANDVLVRMEHITGLYERLDAAGG